MNKSSRDLGLNHSAGKGDADRSDRKKFVEGLKRIELHPEDKTGFVQIGLRRYRKTYHPTPPELHQASNSAIRGLLNCSGCSSDH